MEERIDQLASFQADILLVQEVPRRAAPLLSTLVHIVRAQLSTLPVYVDAYRLRHLEGDELGREALKAWLRQRGSQLSRLLEVAAPFPKALGRLREDVRVLL